MSRNSKHLALILALVSVALIGALMPAYAQDVTEVIYWTTTDDITATDLLEEFNSTHPDIRIVAEMVPYQQHYDRVTTGFAAGALPDLISVPNVNAGKTWASAGILMPLDSYIASSSISEDDYFEAAWAPGVLDGQVYGIPKDIDTRGLAYNIDLFKEAGLEPPTNWEEFLAAAQALTHDDVYGFTPECGGGGGCMVYDFGMFVVGNGGYIVSPDGTQCWANRPETVQALEFWVQLDPYTLKGWWEMTNEMDTLFANGKVGMMVAGPWKMSMEDINPDMVLGVNYDIAPFPGSGNPGAPEYTGTMGGWMMSISSTSEKADAAWQYIEWLQDPARIAQYTSALPISHASATEPRWEAKQYTEVYIPLALPNSRPPAGLSPAVLEIYDLELTAVQLAVLGQATPQQALDDLCAKVDPLLAS